MDSIADFNDIIQSMVDHGYNIEISDRGSLDVVKEDLQSLLDQKSNPPGPQLKIYYPISAPNIFPPVPVIYSTPGPISSRQIIESIFNFYQTRLLPENIAAYREKNMARYKDLEPGMTVANAVSPFTSFLYRLRPFEDGYRLYLV